MIKHRLAQVSQLLSFAWPIIFGQLAQMLIGAGDVWVAGLRGKELLASMSIANALYSPCLMLGLGLIVAVSPYLAKKKGEGLVLLQSVRSLGVYATVMGIISGIILLLLALLFPSMGFDPLLAKKGQNFLLGMIPSFWPTFLFLVYKEYLQANGQTKWASILTLLAVFINLGLCYFFTLYLHWDEWGLALSTNCCRWLMLVGLLPAVARQHRRDQENVLHAKIPPEGIEYRDLLAQGMPVSFSFLLEVGAFAGTTFLIGKLGAVEVSAHQIVLTWASMTFMIPLGISSAVSTKVGHDYGAKNWPRMREWMQSGILLSLGCMILTALIFILLPRPLLGPFTHEEQVLQVGVELLWVAGIFQIFDGLQVTLSGCLRGMNKTRPIFFSSILAYWVLALPIGYYFAFIQGRGSVGLWMGLALGLFTASLCQGIVLLKELWAHRPRP